MPTFTRKERLKGRTAIASLFHGGHSFVAYPLRVVWKDAPSEGGENALEGEEETEIRAQIAVTVSKRNFKNAVDRNRIKRQIREAYRLKKQDLYEKLVRSDKHIYLIVSYIAKESLPFADISSGIEKLIRKFPGRSQA